MKNLAGFRRALAITVFGMLITGGLHAANTMHMGSASMGPGQPFTLRVSISNSNPFVAFQFDLPIPAGFSYVGNSAVLNPARTSGHALQAQMIDGNTLRVLGYSPNNIPFTGDTGAIVTFQLVSGTVPGAFPLNLQAPIIGDVNQMNILTESSNGTATVLAQDINIMATSIDFGRTPLGQSATRTLQIANTGNQPLNILSITFNSPFFEVVGSSTFSISAGQATVVTIRFNSIVKGFYNKVMTIVSNDPDEAIILVALQSHAYAVNELHTGNLSVFSGKQGTLSFSVNNMEGFTGLQFDLQLPSPFTWIAGSAVLTDRKTNHIVSANIVAGNQLRVVAYSPDMQVFNGTTGAVLDLGFHIEGAGGAYPLNIVNVVIGNTLGENILSDSYNGTLQIAAPDISCSSDINFGDVSVLENGYQNLQVYNYGNDTLKIHQVTFTNPSFSLVTELPQAILPSENKPIQIVFHQPGEEMVSGIMKIFSNDPESFENPMLVNLSANAFMPNYMSLPFLDCRNIDTVAVPLKVSNIESFVGLQSDIGFPPFLSYIPNSATLTSRAQDHMLSVTLLDTTHLRLIAFSMTGKPFEGDTGAVVILKFVVNSLNTAVTTAPLTLMNAVLGNNLLQNILYAVNDGILNIEYPRTLSGTCTYNNIQNTPIGSLKVILEENGERLDSLNTVANGDYSFTGIYKGAYVLKMETTEPWAGVNGTDALKIQLHVVGIELLAPPVRVTAADVNKNGYASAVDALHVKKRFVGLDSSFVRGDWTFEKCSGGDTVVMTGSDQAVNFYGLCVGDVNGSHIPGTGSKAGQKVDVSVDKVIGSRANRELFIPVSLDGEFDLGALSLVLEFPKELVMIEDVTVVQGTPVYGIKDNFLSIAWSEPKPLKVFRDEPVLFLKVRTTSNFQEGQVIRFTNASELSEVADKNANIIHGLKINIPTVLSSGSSGDLEMALIPNPARQFTSLIFRTDEEGKAIVALFDQTGRKTDQKTIPDITAGLSRIDLNISDYKPGVYILKLDFEGTTCSFHRDTMLIIGR